MKTTNRKRTNLHVELLESRQLLSITSTPALAADRWVYLASNNNASEVAIVQTGDQIQVFDTTNGLSRTFSTTGPNGILGVHFTGGSGNDRVLNYSANLPVTALGNGGNDYLRGSNGKDVLLGGDGNDVLLGFGGNDILTGGANDDYLYGMNENDYLEGGEGKDALIGGEGNNQMLGDGGDDYLEGGDGNDTMKGGAGNDDLRGLNGDDQLAGEGEDDYIEGGAGNDNIKGGAGNDTILGDAGDNSLYGEAGHDFIRGGVGNEVLDGGDGNDTLWGHGGNDQMWGGDGNDGIYGMAGDDQLFGEAGNDAVVGGDDNDIQWGGDGNDQVFGEGGNDQLRGGANDDNLEGGSGQDTLWGDGGNDVVAGHEGNDILWGGDGNDQMYGAAGDDQILAEAGDDYIQGGEGNDYVVGGSGADTMLGYGGNDRMWGGDGNDWLYGMVGDDQLVGDAGNDSLIGGDDNDMQWGGDGNDRMFGEGGLDVLYGGAGDDYLDGGAGKDSFDGGAGNDTFLRSLFFSGFGLSEVQVPYSIEYSERPDVPVPCSCAYLNDLRNTETRDSQWDIAQRGSPTCAFMAALSAVAERTGATDDLVQKISYNSTTDQYGINLYISGSWRTYWVTGDWTEDRDPAGRLWTTLYQKAYLQAMGVNCRDADGRMLPESQWVSTQGTSWQQSGVAMQALTGKSSSWVANSAMNASTMRTQIYASTTRGMVASSLKSGTTNNIVPDHSYMVYDAYTQNGVWMIRLYNPWNTDGIRDANGTYTFGSTDGTDDGLITLTWTQFKANFTGYYLNNI